MGNGREEMQAVRADLQVPTAHAHGPPTADMGTKLKRQGGNQPISDITNRRCQLDDRVPTWSPELPSRRHQSPTIPGRPQAYNRRPTHDGKSLAEPPVTGSKGV